MRPKIVIGFVVLPIIIVLLAIFIKLKAEKPVVVSNNISTPIATNSDVQPVVNNTSFANTTIQMPDLSSPAAPTNELSPEEKQNQINSEIDRLNSAYVVRDEASRALIISDLTNSDPQVRTAALEAAKQLGDRSLVPILQDLATNTADYEEHHAVLAAADFLSLPTMEEAQVNWTPGPNAIPPSVARQNLRRSRRPAPAPAQSDTPANSAMPAGDQNAIQSPPPTTEN
jgi:hypothetical protein